MKDEFTNRWSYDVCWRGIKVLPGQTVTSEGKQKETIDNKLNQKEDSNGIEQLRKKLLDKKMKDLRKIGYEYGAKDTSKKELVEEIIQAKIIKGDI